MTLKSWDQLPLQLRRNKKKLYNHLYDNTSISLVAWNSLPGVLHYSTRKLWDEIATKVNDVADVPKWNNLTGRPNLTYKNIPVKYAPVLDAADGRTVFGNVPSILTVPEYTYYGVYKDLSIEPHRDTANERTEYYYRIRCAAALQFPSAFVTGVMTATEAASVQADNKV